MATHIRCGSLFTGKSTSAEKDQTIVVEDERVSFVGPTATAPRPAAADKVIDHGAAFVSPGLIDVHVHLSYGNAHNEEDIDLYAPVEFRAVRAMMGAQQVLAAGYTALADPAITGRVTIAVRDAINAGLYVGPRISCSGRQITPRQGLADYYPTWIGVPETSVGVLVRSVTEAIEEIRTEVKDGVDFIKIAADGVYINPQTGELGGCFSQGELDAIVGEAHRLGRKVISHARGKEATLQSARAGCDVIFHAFYIDDAAIDICLAKNIMLCPTFALMVNGYEFTQATDGNYRARDMMKRIVEEGVPNLLKAKQAGVKFLVGTDSGFAITPYGEWHARELEFYVKLMGFTPAEALQATTVNNATMLRDGADIGTIEVGRFADLLVVDKDPLADIRILQDKKNIVAIYKGGAAVKVPKHVFNPAKVSKFSYDMWRDMYTQERVKQVPTRSIAAE
ncbi:MAG: amidohydrolase family protein [Alphaproteobacteria bacterium]|nr:amidohydrolase family protein [Alphaproteobacteria bacterium]